jgi:hypothetical protein
VAVVELSETEVVAYTTLVGCSLGVRTGDHRSTLHNNGAFIRCDSAGGGGVYLFPLQGLEDITSKGRPRPNGLRNIGPLEV